MRDPTESRAAPYALFHGLLLAAVTLGVVEAVQLAVSGGLGPGERWTAAFYVLMPYVLFGLAVAATAAGLAGLWTRARRIGSTTRRLSRDSRPVRLQRKTQVADAEVVPDSADDPGAATHGPPADGAIDDVEPIDDPPPSRMADAGAGLLAVVFFAGLVYVPARLLLAYTHNRALGAGALAGWTPVAAIGALYFWAVARMRLAHLDRRWALGSRVVTFALTAIGLLAIGFTVARNEALRERLGGWTAGFIVAYPLLTLALTMALRRLGPARLGGPAVRRAVLAAAIVSAIGAADLVVHIDARGTIKRALLHETLVFQPLVIVAQPLFDADGDGYAGMLGGGDCDDDDPDINPGATEKPGNGVDENCRGGDVRPRLKRKRLPKTDKPVFKTPKPVERPFIVLLVLDSVRADHFGDADDLMPNLTAIQQAGTTFTRAYSPAASTRLTMPALMAGRWVGYTEYEERMGHYFTDEEVPVLAEVLGRKRYRTMAVLPPFIHARLHGLGRGFARYVNFGRQGRVRAARGRTEPLAVEDALELLAEDHPYPAFLYVHVDGGHHAYSRTGARVGDNTPYGRYRGELERMDRDLKPLLDRLLEIARHRPMVLAITADHGEAFGEHGFYFHGNSLHEESVRVPLVLYGPERIPGGKRIDTPVDLLDLGVTLARAGGTRLPGAQGHDLWGLIDGKPAPKAARPLFFGGRVLWKPSPVIAAVQRWPLKLIRRMDTGEEELYDLAADPGETRNLRDARPKDAGALRELLFAWSDGGSGPAGRRVKDRPRSAGGKRFEE